MPAMDYRLEGEVAVLTMANPPVNALSLAVRTGLMQGLERAAADAAVTAIVLTGQGGCFSGGADINEIASGVALTPPTLRDLQGQMEASRQAAGGGHRGNRSRRRLRAGAHLPLAPRHPGRERRPPGGEARTHSRSRRHAALHASRGAASRARGDHQRRTDPGRARAPAAPRRWPRRRRACGRGCLCAAGGPGALATAGDERSDRSDRRRES